MWQATERHKYDSKLMYVEFADKMLTFAVKHSDLTTNTN